jgi:nicotinamidase-related amidase
MKEALLLIDIQNDYFPGGAMECVGMEEATDAAAALLEMFRRDEKPVFFIRHISVREGAGFFLPGTRGSEIHDRVAPVPGEAVIEKNFPNSFFQTELLAALGEKGVSECVICGAMSHMCIDATTRAAREAGFACTVVEDACATRDLVFSGKTVPAASVHAAFMAALNGMYARVVTLEEYISGRKQER